MSERARNVMFGSDLFVAVCPDLRVGPALCSSHSSVAYTFYGKISREERAFRYIPAGLNIIRMNTNIY